MTDINLEVHPKFLPLFKPWDEREGYRYYVMYGGRAGLKTWACVQAIVILCDDSRLKVTCAREFQKNIRESVHAEIASCIERLGLSHRYEIQVDRIINLVTGSEITFLGLHNNPNGIKGLANREICWVEEAEAVSKESWSKLTPTIRKGGSEIWVTFNPADEMDETYVRFITNPRRKSWVIETSYRDAEAAGWFPDELREEMEQMMEENYDEYLNIWLGVPNSNYEDAIIKKEWFDAAVDAHKKLNWEPLGAKISSFDPADTGDEKAVAVRHGFLLEKLENWNNGDIVSSIQKAFLESSIGGASHMVYDADGLGVSMKINLDQNEANYSMKTSEFHGGARVDDPDSPYPPIDPSRPYPERVVTNKNRFRNKRAQYYWFLRDRFLNTYNAVANNKWISPDQCISISSEIPEAIRLQARQQVTRIRKKRGSDNSLITLESKQDMRKAGIRSPGLADCMMMVFADPPVFGQKLNFKVGRIC